MSKRNSRKSITNGNGLTANQVQQQSFFGSDSTGGVLGYAKDWLARRVGFNNRRDILADVNLDSPDIYGMKAMYEFLSIARRVGDTFPEATWTSDIKVTDNEDTDNESPFDKAWNDFVKEHNIWNLLTRLDKSLAYSPYSVIRFGIQDNLDPELPIGTHNQAHKVFFTIHSQINASMQSFNRDKTDPMFGYPETYKIRTGGTESGVSSGGVGLGSGQIPRSDIIVHASRVLHVAEHRGENDLVGSARLQHVYFDLKSLIKVLYSASESWYQRTRNPYVLSLNEQNAGKITAEDLKAFDQIWADVIDGGYSKALTIKNGTVDVVQSQVDDPTGHIDTILKGISGGTRIPVRILVGSERGELASSQDASNFASAVHQRRTEFCENEILRPFIMKCVEVGILPKPQGGENGMIDIQWPDLVKENSKDRASTANQVANAIKAFDQGNGQAYLTKKQFVEEILDKEFMEEECEAYEQEMEQKADEMFEREQMANNPPESDKSGDSSKSGKGDRKEENRKEENDKDTDNK